MQKQDFRNKINRKLELLYSLGKRIKKARIAKGGGDDISSIGVAHKVDVAVVGGGISGIVAALAAARMGAKTLLIEQHGVLGGLATIGLIPPISNQFFDASGRQVIKGIAEEIMDLLAQNNATIIDWRDWKIPKFPFDIEIFKLIVYELLEAAKVKVMVNTFYSGLQADGDRIEKIVVENKSGRLGIEASQFIDCTGDAILAIHAGAPCNINSDLSESSSDEALKALLKRIGWKQRTEKTASLQFAITGVDFDAFYDYILSQPENFDVTWRGELKEDIELFKYLWEEKGLFYIPHTNNFESEIKKAQRDGFFKTHTWRYRSIGECNISIDGLRSNGILTVTANKVRIDPFFDEDLTMAMLKGQEICVEAWRFLKEYIPGFRDSVLIAVAPLLGIRRSAQIIGSKVFTVQEREEELEYDDLIGMYSRKTKKAREIPYACMIPQIITNLIIGSGKSVSTDEFVMYRTKPHCMIIGEAAGVAAALCADKNVSPAELSIRTLQRALLEKGVFLGDKDRLSRLGL